LLRTAEEIVEKLDEAYIQAVSGKPGPAWLDVPVDLQGVMLPVELEAKVLAP
jgi:acetolactate synthase-1/2/3 large subunit